MSILLASRLLVGLLLLVLGRRLYWLFVAGVGFLAGLEIAPRLFPDQSETVIVIMALVLALVGALVAVLATQIAVGVIGFVAGGSIAGLLLRDMTLSSDAIRLAAYLIAGLIGALLLLVLFDWALILLSALAGASLIEVSLERLFAIPPLFGTAIIVVLTVIGILIQSQVTGDRAHRV